MATITSHIGDQGMDFNPVTVIDDVIKYVQGGSEGWDIFDSGMKIVLTPPKGEPYWFLYSRNRLTEEYLIGVIVRWMMNREDS